MELLTGLRAWVSAGDKGGMTQMHTWRAMNRFANGFRALMALALVSGALLFPAAAGAQQDCTGPAGDQYCPKTEVLTGGGGDSGAGDPQDPSGTSSGLPFTGFDIALSIAAGAGLLGAGLALRRASRVRDAAG
jgi:hypothetical protein